MELPPQSRPFGTAQGTKPTHDFLSLYTHSSLQQDPRPSHGFLKTHNFLQPLEEEEKNAPKEDSSVGMNVEKSSPAAPSPSVVEHLLPIGVGTYSIGQISYLNPRVPKPEENVFTVAPVTINARDDENSNCSSYTGSGFTLWDESAARKGNTGEENLGDVNVHKESSTKVGLWPLDRLSQSSYNHRSSVSPLSSQAVMQKNQSFMEMIKSAKEPHSLEEEEEEDEGELNIKKESSSSQKGELRVKLDGRSSVQKANTPRSKHSATEQRRRCKINDRFQMLRELIPHSDQKRDKASFLLEVIEYIQFLQEKVSRYEGPYPGWNSEPAKLTPWMQRNTHGPTGILVNQSQVVNGVTSPLLMFGSKLDEKDSAINFKTVGQQSGMANKVVPISSPLQPSVYAPTRISCAVTQPTPRLPSDGDDPSLGRLQLWQNGAAASEPASTADKFKDKELAVEGGTISISSIYSQGLFNTLTRSLQSSGVDLSHASISVQVDIAKRANNQHNSLDPIEKAAEVPNSNQSVLRTRVESSSSESDHAVKRLKTG